MEEDQQSNKVYKISVGKPDYSIQHGEEILELLKEGQKEENQKKLIEHFDAGWRPFHPRAKDSTASFLPALLANSANHQAKYLFVDEISLKEKVENGTVLDLIFTKVEVVVKINENNGNDFAFPIKDEVVVKAFQANFALLEETQRVHYKKWADNAGITLTSTAKPADKPAEAPKEAAKTETASVPEVKPEEPKAS